ncbi:MAG: PorV/PorQ family protein [Candidatus Eisenbacteria bacterium]
MTAAAPFASPMVSAGSRRRVLLAARSFGLAALLLAAGGGAASAGTTTGFAFLDLPAGARIAALGGAGTTLADGPLALFWNPAGIAPETVPADGSRARIEFDHHESIQSFRQDIVGGVVHKGGDGIGMALNAHYTESIQERDPLGNLTGSFGATDIAATFGYAATAAPGLRLGGALQWAHEDLAGNGASALGVSAGGLYAVAAVPGLVLGAAVRNLGGSPSFKTDTGADGAKVPQPLTVSTGASYGRTHAGGFAWRAAADVLKLKGDSLEGRLGLEVQPVSALALRAGWMLGQDAADFTAGAGISVGRFDFDYAFVPYHDQLGSSHRIGLGARL